jgi:ubiquinone/menaquinone biosynthesis C-methylase UbiE
MAGQRTQEQIDRANADFWDELCGSLFAKTLGITDGSPESIARFDRAYFDYYPYLLGYVPEGIAGKRVLEIGLGYGSLSQALAERGADYNGLDIAEGPVEMVRERLRRIGVDDVETRVRQGSALEIPHEDASFDHVISIGCLHVTGDFAGAVREVHRVLRPGGTAVVMVYAKHSFRRYLLSVQKAPYLLRGGREVYRREFRRAYDHTVAGEAAPTMEYLDKGEVRSAFAGFRKVRMRRENFHDIRLTKTRTLPRDRFLGNLAHLAGLDLYITGEK